MIHSPRSCMPPLTSSPDPKVSGCLASIAASWPSIKQTMTTFCVCFSILFLPTLYGKDFGIRGELFTLDEENLISVIQRQMSQTSSLQTVKSVLQNFQEKAKHPTSPYVPPRAQSNSTHYFDPTYITKEPITDQNGAIIFPKGTKVNPLKNIKLSSGLLFFDGNDPTQLRWARNQQGSFKWVLVQGNPFELEQQEKRPIYFDQMGTSVEKFHIQHIPARITQEGLRLKIEELSPDTMENHS